MDFYTSIDWHHKFHYDYYLFFNDQDPEKRIGSVFAFLGMLINWFHRSSFAFYPDTGKPFSECPNKIEKYLVALKSNSNNIKKELPKMHSSICYLLYQLDKDKDFDNEFPHVDKKIFKEMRKMLQSEDFNKKVNFDEVFQELKGKINN